MKYKLQNGKEIDLQAIAARFAELAKSEPKDSGEVDPYYFPHELAIAQEWHKMGMQPKEVRGIQDLNRGKHYSPHLSSIMFLFSCHPSIRGKLS